LRFVTRFVTVSYMSTDLHSAEIIRAFAAYEAMQESDRLAERGIVGAAVVIEAGQYANTCGVVDAVSASGKMVDVLTADGVVTVRRSSVEVYS
jgi:transcription antitermination factor NusG